MNVRSKLCIVFVLLQFVQVRLYAQEFRNISRSDFQSILDKSNLRGAILIEDVSQDIRYSNNFALSDSGFLPASTFKIPNSIIALETGVVASDSSVFHWNGEKRRLKQWERDLTFREAIEVSCVPCYREVARKIGVSRMREYLQKFGYGKLEVDSNTLDLFWLEGNSRISASEQIDFLKKFYFKKLPVSERTHEIVRSMIVNDTTEGYKLSGKTGWAIRDEHNTGWYVGYLETKDKVYFFATVFEPGPEFNMDSFARIRKEVTMEAFRKLAIIN
jgi:beta-lactamase class D